MDGGVRGVGQGVGDKHHVFKGEFPVLHFLDAPIYKAVEKILTAGSYPQRDGDGRDNECVTNPCGREGETEEASASPAISPRPPLLTPQRLPRPSVLSLSCLSISGVGVGFASVCPIAVSASRSSRSVAAACCTPTARLL
jgi:hypothetical protein